MRFFRQSFVIATFIFVHSCLCYRLPTSLHPTHYDLEVIVSLDGKFDFSGKVAIEIAVTHPTHNITLHSKGLQIHENKIELLESPDKKAIKLKDFKVEADNDFFIIFVDEKLKEGKYKLTIPYSGVLENGLDGFYRSSYVDQTTGEHRNIGVTQFEAISARKAFPCFDEPAMKATYNMSIGRHKNYTSVSNMPILKTEKMKEKEGWYLDIFEKSVPMSTYLVAWMVSDFGFEKSDHKLNNVSFKIWSRKDALNQLHFASETGPRALHFFEEFFDIDYPLPKVDMAALPDFNAGAMENWGLITYRESYLLHDPEKSSLYSKESVASVISHELAHQWFGNLVTMKWWTDLWLNEGFATYMATVAVDKLFPEWKVKDEDAINNIMSVFKLDSLKSSHPVSVPIANPRDIDQIFDTISYKKGSSLIRMMAMFLGEEVLRKGVRNYLIKHQYKNAEQDDLWEALTDEAHKENILPKSVTVKEIMDTWTLQTGYPVVNVHRNYESNHLSITQKRFLRDLEQKELKENCWWIPITHTYQKELNFKKSQPSSWLNCSSKHEIVEKVKAGENEWVIFNIHGAGLYRVNYDKKNWDLLVNALNSDKYADISIFNRVLLLEDAASFAFTNTLSYETFFGLLNYLERESDYLPWDIALSKVRGIRTLLLRTPAFGKFKGFLKKLLEKPYHKFGGLQSHKGTEPEALKKQVLIAGTACSFGVQNCIDDAVKLFKDMKENNATIPKDFRKTIFCMGIKYGDANDWEFLWNKYLKSNNPNEKNHIMWTLGCTEEIWLLQRYLDRILEPNSGIRKQDADAVFNTVVNNPVGFYVAKSFLEENIEKLANYIGKNKRMSRYIAPLAQNLISQLQLDSFQNFTQQYETLLLDAKQVVNQSIETVKINVQWHKQNYEKINELLQKY